MLTQPPPPAELDEVITGYHERIRSAAMPPAVRVEALRQLARLRWVPADGVEHYVIRGYLEAVIELPWPEREGMERRLLDSMRGSDGAEPGVGPLDSVVPQDDPCGPATVSDEQPYVWDSAAMTLSAPDAAEQAPKKVR
jgi:hypothetical protein